MDKISVLFEDIRGLGDVISPKSSSDFVLYSSLISTTSDTVNGITTQVYNLVRDSTTFVLTVTQQYVKSGSDVTVTVTLTDAEGDPVEGASIDLYKVIE